MIISHNMKAELEKFLDDQFKSSAISPFTEILPSLTFFCILASPLCLNILRNSKRADSLRCQISSGNKGSILFKRYIFVELPWFAAYPKHPLNCMTDLCLTDQFVIVWDDHSCLKITKSNILGLREVWSPLKTLFFSEMWIKSKLCYQRKMAVK